MKQENRRVKLTKRLLTDSFLQLLDQKPVSRITVKEICDSADLNRSTYYRYFIDPYDQMQKLETELIEEIAVCIDLERAKEGPPYKWDELCVAIQRILEQISVKRNVFRVLLHAHGECHLQRDFLTVLAKKLMPQELQNPVNSTLLQEFIFISNGAFGMIYYWLMGDMHESIDELSRKIASYCLAIFAHSGQQTLHPARAAGMHN